MQISIGNVVGNAEAFGTRLCVCTTINKHAIGTNQSFN